MRVDPLTLFVSEDYLEKLAEDSAPPRKMDPGEKALAGLVTQSSAYAIALPWVGSEILKHFAEKDSVRVPGGVFGQGKGKLFNLIDLTERAKVPSPEEEAQIARKLGEIQESVEGFFKKHDLASRGVQQLRLRSGPLSTGIGPHYDTATKTVFAPRVSKAILLHELGHAADYTAGPIGKIRAIAEPVFQRGVTAALPIALIAGDEIAKALPGTVDDRAIKFMQDHAPEIMGATLAATQLFPEAKASYLAVKHLHATEGGAEAWSAAKKLLPAWGTYALRIIPPIVGMALARKYLRQARDEGGQEKTGSVGEELSKAITSFVEMGKDISHVGREIGRGVGQLVKDPAFGERVWNATKAVGSSPPFVVGALSTALPATAGALYLYGTSPGKVLRSQVKAVGRDATEVIPNRPRDEEWRERHPLAFAGIVGAGAALSAGILSKLFSDLKEVL